MRKWFAVIALMCESKKGISAAQVARHIGVTYKVAWHLCHRIRHAMQESPDFTVGGPSVTVEMDEAYIGGRRRLQGVKGALSRKTVVIGLAERHGRIHMQTAERAGLKHLRKAFSRVDPETPKVVTDGNQLYRGVVPKEKHEQGNHAEELKDKNRVTSTYTVESAFSLFKRGIVGSYHRLSAEHLNRYLGEFCWRYNRRRMQPWIFQMVLENMSRLPLSYKKLTDDGFNRFASDLEEWYAGTF